MKKPILWVLLASVLGIVPQATAKVSTRVCLADGNTPLELRDPNIPFVYRDIMAGTRLTIIVSSDAAEMWGGGLFIADPYRDYGILSGCLCLEAAGGAGVNYWSDEVISGFDLYTDRSAVPGDWFITDYNATAIGDCNVGFYDYSSPGGTDFPVYYLVFSHVPTRDFNKDTKVDFSDFAILASYWQETGCNDPNWCEGTDLDTDSNVDSNDLMLFTDYWLEKTE